MIHFHLPSFTGCMEVTSKLQLSLKVVRACEAILGSRKLESYKEDSHGSAGVIIMTASPKCASKQDLTSVGSCAFTIGPTAD